MPEAQHQASQSPIPALKLPILLRGVAWSMVSVMIFSFWFVATRFSVTHDLRFWDVIALRFGVGAVLLLPVLIIKRRRLMARAGEGFIFAVLWGAPFVLLLTLGLQMTTAAESSAVTPTLMPVFAGLIGWIVLREKLGPTKWAGYAAIAAGLAILMLNDPVANVSSNPADLAPLALASVLWAIYTIRFRRSDMTPLEGATLMCFWSAVMFLPPYFMFGLSRLHLASTQELVFQAVYQGLLMSVVAIISFNRAITLIGPRAAAAIIAFVPLTTALLAIPLIGEVPSSSGAVAICVIALGVIITAWPSRSKK
ncbi:MAG: DMT family transporter [Lacisediminimonas sp.]|nr:DMT family transporter [Lacisediminimonas sp.]